MNEATSQEQISLLTEQLADKDGMTREGARKQLVEIGGHDVTRALVVKLNDLRRDVRWEACKALISIADPIAATALVHRLHDQDSDIRWLAAEGVAQLGEQGLFATLNAAIYNASNSDFCRAAHQALKEFQRHAVHATELAPVIEACENSEPAVSLPVAAFNALQQIKGTNEETL